VRTRWNEHTKVTSFRSCRWISKDHNVSKEKSALGEKPCPILTTYTNGL
jgi:hypothetical protein